jgi:hypothetical protein
MREYSFMRVSSSSGKLLDGPIVMAGEDVARTLSFADLCDLDVNGLVGGAIRVNGLHFTDVFIPIPEQS